MTQATFNAIAGEFPVRVFFCASLRKIQSFSLMLTSLIFVNVHAVETSFHGDFTLDSSYIDSDVDNKLVTRGLLNLGFESNLTELIGKESYLTASYSIKRGGNGSDIAGDIQTFSNIDDDDFNRLFEVIFTAHFSDYAFIKLGQMDVNSYFATTAYGGEFINSSMGFSPTVQGLPTYPQPAIGLYTEFTLNPSISARLGYFESSASYNHFDDFFSIAETQWNYQANSSIKLGLWHHSGLTMSDETINTNKSTKSSSDFYLVVDHQFNQKVSAFLQWGQADASLVEIEQHIGFGLHYHSAFIAQDAIGVGFTQVDVVGADKEQVSEIFYLYPISEQLAIKPDLQFISSPSGNNEIDDSLAFTLRLTANF
ncbi:MAG: carbohydrate porin [Thalassotalea sp.]